MLLQNEDIGDAFSGMFKHLKIRVTTKCNMACAHCYAAQEQYPYEPQRLENFEWVERLFKNDKIEYMHIQGGEPTLEFDAIKKCREIARKYNKPCCVFTNGKVLYEDLEFRKRFDEEICPDMLVVSYNNFLDTQTDQVKVVNTLAAHYKDHPTIKFGSTAIIDNTKLDALYQWILYQGWPPYHPEWWPEIEAKLDFDYWKFQLPLCESHRGKNTGTNKITPKQKWPIIACDFSTVLMPSGFLQADCGCSSVKKCTLGHIDDFGDDPIKYIFEHKAVHGARNAFIGDYFEICRDNDKITCLDKYPPHSLPEELYTRRFEGDNV